MKKKVSKSSILFIVGSMLVVGSGTTIGLLLGQKYFDFDIPDAEIDEHDDSLYEKYLLLKKTNVTTSKLIDEFRPYQLVKLGLMNFEKASHAQITATGSVDASISNQSVTSKYIKINDTYFAESLSFGKMVKVGWRYYQTNDEIKVYKANKLSDTYSASWPNEDKTTEVHTLESFKETWGKSMTLPFIYTLNSITVDEESCKEDGDNIVVDLSLQPELSTVNYGKQMKKTSDLKGVPTFNLVTLKFTLSSDLMITKNEIYEKYSVPYGFSVPTTGAITEEYTYLDNISIPSLDENANYN
ncbi:MAG: hypothetical protein J1F31_04270 [Erysipelotrichales bacterium]|nr:hypothetical protein [Erysipelotrichales bacterium]